ncbi:MAG: hypothetical protein ABFS46_11615 [Myxococcota bacterium]
MPRRAHLGEEAVGLAELVLADGLVAEELGELRSRLVQGRGMRLHPCLLQERG